MINISNALLIVRPVVKVYCDTHGMFASALITRNVNRILRHGNSFASLFTTVGQCLIKNLSVCQMARDAGAFRSLDARFDCPERFGSTVWFLSGQLWKNVKVC